MPYYFFDRLQKCFIKGGICVIKSFNYFLYKSVNKLFGYILCIYNQVIAESGIAYSPRPKINPYGYGFQVPPPWDAGLMTDNYASRKRRGGI